MGPGGSAGVTRHKGEGPLWLRPIARGGRPVSGVEASGVRGQRNRERRQSSGERGWLTQSGSLGDAAWRAKMSPRGDCMLGPVCQVPQGGSWWNTVEELVGQGPRPQVFPTLLMAPLFLVASSPVTPNGLFFFFSPSGLFDGSHYKAFPPVWLHLGLLFCPFLFQRKSSPTQLPSC